MKKRRLLNLIAPFYLGFALAQFANIDFLNWKFYAIIVPFFILVLITGFNKED
jgi:hypothetical protein